MCELKGTAIDSERITQRLNIASASRYRADIDLNESFAFPSLKISPDENEALQYALNNISNSRLLGDVQTKEEIAQIMDSISESLQILTESKSSLGQSIYVLLSEEKYLSILRLIEYDDFRADSLYLLSQLFWPDMSQRSIEVINFPFKSNVSGKIVEYLFGLLCDTNAPFLDFIMTYISNLLLFSTPFRDIFISSKDNFEVILSLPQQLNKRKIRILVNLLNGPLLHEEVERYVLHHSIEISLGMNPRLFRKFLRPFLNLSEQSSSTIKEIICSEHLVDHLTIIAQCEKMSRRIMALDILANCAYYGPPMLKEMVTFGTTNLVHDILTSVKDDYSLVSASRLINNWLVSSDSSEYDMFLISKLSNLDFLRLIDSQSYSLKKSIIGIISKMISIGGYKENIKIVTPQLIKKLCEIASNSEEKVIGNIVKILDSFVDSCSSSDHIIELANQIYSEFPLDDVQQIVLGNETIIKDLDSFTERISSIIAQE